MIDQKSLIRIEEIPLELNEPEAVLKNKAAAILGVPEAAIVSVAVVKRAVDSRHPEHIFFVYSLDVCLADQAVVTAWGGRYRVRPFTPYDYQIKAAVPGAWPPVVVGAGPAGLFAALALATAGLHPVLLERGQALEERVATVNNFFATGALDPESNIQFGEGGAGTFSDGKLYTLINDPRSSYVFKQFVAAGAPADILINATPHIGTDHLRTVVKNLRQRIIDLGGTVRFGAKVTGLTSKNGHISGVVINNGESLATDTLVLAIGHSARDTYQWLYDQGLNFEAKPFSIGVRIEHARAALDKARYGRFSNYPGLGAAKYKLVVHTPGERSAYTFCMCPGGSVVAAASEAGGLTTNGMSFYNQGGANSNSALLVPVTPADFGSADPLAGIAFQRFWEQRAYEAGGGAYRAPIQLVGDFLAKRPSTRYGAVIPSYPRGVTPTELDNCLPDYVIRSLRAALPQFAKKIKGFAAPEAVLTGIETRSSSPVRLLRDKETYQASLAGLYPCGEGAGYAGGIVSSAIDGLAVAEAIIAATLK